MNELISVIVPIYMVEDYLERCIESIVNQTYKNLDIILVDDGSLDNCPKLCDEWSKKDIRIRVIHKKNGGLSDARNCGIKHAKGKYITFVDSDDWLPLNSIEDLYFALVNNKCDISVGLLKEVYNSVNKCDTIKIKEQVYKNTDALEELMYLHYFSNSAPGKLYKTNLFNNIKFPVGKHYEDLATTHRLFSKSKSISLIKRNIYFYYQNSTSIMHKKYTSKRLEGLYFAIDELNFIEKYYDSITPSAIYRLFFECLSIINDMPFKCHDKKIVMKYIKKYRRQVISDNKLWKKQKLLCFSSYFGQLGIKLSFFFKTKLR